MLKKIDRYIIQKYLVTFFVAIFLILALSIVFDFSEKMDRLIGGRAGIKPTTHEIIFNYYGGFVPYFANLFSPLFAFISVIFFTSRMASRLEIISILATGTSYRRLLYPFVVAAIVISSLSWCVTNFVLPSANAKRIEFEKKYFGWGNMVAFHFHRQIAPNEFVYVESFNHEENFATKFSYEKHENNQIVKKILSQSAHFDSLTDSWKLNDYIIREFDGEKESLRRGMYFDTIFGKDVNPTYFKLDLKLAESLTNKDLDAFIENEKSKGSSFINVYLLEKHQRNSNPFSTVILTLLAVPIASRKVRGGIGFHLAMGVALAFGYIFLNKITSTYAVNNSIPPLLAVWLPNIVFCIVALFLIKKAQK